MTEQPTALLIADNLGKPWTLLSDQVKAAEELRRLHAENEALRAANEAFGERQEWWNERMVILEQQRDELLGILQAMANELAKVYPIHSVKSARAAIAKVEEQI